MIVSDHQSILYEFSQSERSLGYVSAAAVDVDLLQCIVKLTFFTRRLQYTADASQRATGHLQAKSPDILVH
jgi:hypothetical protein